MRRRALMGVFLVVGLTVACTNADNQSTAPPASAGTATEASSTAPAPCDPAKLWLAAADEDSAGGHGVVVVAVSNTSASACTLSGHPTVTLVGHASDGAVAAKFDAAPSEGGYMLTSAPASVVSLEAGKTGFFGIEDGHVCPPDGSGPLVPVDEAWLVINGKPAPNNGDPLRVRMSTCGSASVGVFRPTVRTAVNG